MPLKHYDSGNEECGIYACVPVTPAHSVPGITAERVGGIGGVVTGRSIYGPTGFPVWTLTHYHKHSSFKPSSLSHLNEERETEEGRELLVRVLFLQLVDTSKRRRQHPLSRITFKFCVMT